MDDGALANALPEFVKKKLEGYFQGCSHAPAALRTNTPAVAQARVTRGPDGLVRIGLEKAFSDGSVAVDLAPLSLLRRLCASVPPPRFHTVRYAGALGSASKLRSRLAPKRASPARASCVEDIAERHERLRVVRRIGGAASCAEAPSATRPPSNPALRRAEARICSAAARAASASACGSVRRAAQSQRCGATRSVTCVAPASSEVCTSSATPLFRIALATRSPSDQVERIG